MVKIMYENKKLLVALMIGLLFVSCANDYNFMDDYSPESWETSLVQIVSENTALYSNSGIFLKHYEEIDINTLDRLSFIDSDSRYPVMTGDKVTLVPYEFIRFDTLMCHVKSFQIDNIVNNLLQHKSELIAVKLYWTVNDSPMNTIALFDKTSNAFVYDNFLFNTICVIDDNKNELRRHNLTRAEWGYYDEQNQGGESISGSDSFSYKNGSDCWIATITLNWIEHGYWELYISEWGDDMYRFDYKYKHTHTDFSWSESRSPEASNGYSLSKDVMELSPNDDNFRIKYFFYIGTNSYPLYLPSASESQINTPYGGGDVRVYVNKPFRYPDFVDKEQFPRID